MKDINKLFKNFLIKFCLRKIKVLKLLKWLLASVPLTRLPCALHKNVMNCNCIPPAFETLFFSCVSFKTHLCIHLHELHLLCTKKKELKQKYNKLELKRASQTVKTKTKSTCYSPRCWWYYSAFIAFYYCTFMHFRGTENWWFLTRESHLPAVDIPYSEKFVSLDNAKRITWFMQESRNAKTLRMTQIGSFQADRKSRQTAKEGERNSWDCRRYCLAQLLSAAYFTCLAHSH